MKKILSALLTAVILLTCLCTFPVSATESAPLSLNAEAALVVNLETGREVFEKNSEKIMYPASLTKILTVLIGLEECPDPKNMVVTIPDTAVFKDVYDEGGATIYLVKGEQLTLWDLMCATMLKSACDAATAVGYFAGGGDLNAFYEKMNTRAVELGAKSSNFVNAHGLHNGNHYTTASDMMAILRAALQNPLFEEIISLTRYTIPKTNKTASRTFEYTVSLVLENSPLYFPEAKGVKTGFTDAAGRCLTTTVCRDGTTYAIVLLGANLDEPVSAEQPVNYAFTDAVSIAGHCFGSYTREIFAHTDKVLTELPLSDNRDYLLTLAADRDIEVLKAGDETVICTYSLPNSIALNDVTKGQAVGTATLSVNGEELSTFSLYPVGYVAASDASLPALSLDNKPTPDKPSHFAPADDDDEDKKSTVDTPTLILCIALFVLVLSALLVLFLSRTKQPTRKPTRYKK